MVSAAGLAPVTRPVSSVFLSCDPAGQRGPPGLPPCPWPWFLPSWGDFAALLLDAEMLKQEEPLALAAGWLLQLLSCSGDPALLDHH